MKELAIELINCHGIRQLGAKLSFKRGNAVSIYAPNGTMKTSFARTFSELARGLATRDRMFPDRATTRSVRDEGGKEIRATDVVVVLSYDEELGPTESTSTLLVNPELRKEYESLQMELLTARDELVTALEKQAKTRKDVSASVSNAFTGSPDGFFLALVRLEYEIAEMEDARFAEIPLDTLFNDKVLSILHTPSLQVELAAYVSRLNDLLDESNFFSRDSFTFYNAANVTKSLGDNGFFAAQHSLILHGGGAESHSITSKADLDALIAVEKKRITDDDTLRKKLEAVEKALNKNVDTRRFFDYILQHVDLLPEFANVEVFEQNLWKSYIKAHEALYVQVVSCYKASERRKKEIETHAATESTQWEHVIDIFNDRFFVPFRLIATNRDRVILGQEKLLKLGFQFEEGIDNRSVERDDLLEVLSNGEKKALYILNVLFEVETRKTLASETLFVIDDIADSFDYKNKYAIIQYLKEMSEEFNFKLVLLTHNFDFFRTLESRSVVRYDHCFMAQKGEAGIVLTQAVGVRNPFIKDFKLRFFDDAMKRIACIPFVRNILEYTKGEDEQDYLRLTGLLHWNGDTSSITQAELDEIFYRVFGVEGSWADPTGSVSDMIIVQATDALGAAEGINFQNKIVMSIGIRLMAERHMIEALADASFVQDIQGSQSSTLLKEYRNRGLGTPETLAVLDSVVLMTPENIHVNSFMYEPIIDMSDTHLRRLFSETLSLSFSDKLAD